MVDITGAVPVMGVVTGTSRVLAQTIKLLKPDLGETLKNKSHLNGYIRYRVPENHRVTRAFRSAWALATVSVLKIAEDAADAGGMASAQKEELRRVCALAREAAQALPVDGKRNEAFPESPIDDHLELVLNMVSDHMLRQTRPDDRTLLNSEFVAWLDVKTGQHGEPMPPLLTSVIEGQEGVDHAEGRSFAYLLVDKIAHIARNPQQYSDDANSLSIAIERLEHRTVERLLNEILIELRNPQDVADLRAVREQVATQYDSLSGQLRAAEDKIRGDVSGVRDDIRDLTDALAPNFNDARRSFGFDEGKPNLVLCGAETDAPWLDSFEQTVSVMMGKLTQDYDLGMRRWDLGNRSLEDAFQAGTKWRQVLQSPDAPHGGTVVLLPRDIGDPLPSDTTFEDFLCEHACLASPDAPSGLYFTDAHTAEERRAMHKSGAVPVTVLTRLIMETHLAGRPLQVFDQVPPEERSGREQNLIGWLEQIRIPMIRDFAGEDDAFVVGQLLNRILEIPADVVVNPYLRLEHFVPADQENYHGRQGAQEQVRSFFDAQAKAGKSPVLRVEGPSGVGKSSFMNARVAHLAEEFGFDYVTFRPTDIMFRRSGGQRPLEAFCQHLASELGWAPPEQDFPLISCPDLDSAAAQAEEWFNKERTRHNRKVLIAIDQFEEILDSIANDWNGAAWNKLITMIEALIGPEVAVVFTLESSRKDLLATSMSDRVYGRASGIVLDDDPEFLRAVIVRPFTVAGFRLHEDTVETLLTEALKYGTSAGETISALPLLTLKLHALFETVVERIPRSNDSLMSDLVDVPPNDIPIQLDIGSEIDSLGWGAWNKVSGTEADFDAFMRPFVRVVKSDGDEKGRMVLATVPNRGFHAVQDRQAAFEQARLIVPAPGGSRLAHEAVIRRWDKARDWFEGVRDKLQEETDFLERANVWDRKGRLRVDTASAEDIVIAARILGHRTTDWAVIDVPNLNPRTRAERAFCLQHLDLATDPLQPVEASTYGSLFVHLAASYGRVDLMRRFLETDRHVMDLPRADGRTPLMAAAFVSDEMVGFLLEEGANPNVLEEDGWTVIDGAIWGERDDIFERLSPIVKSDNTSPIVNDDGSTDHQPCINALYSAAAMGRLDLMHELEEKGWKHDQETRGGTTPIMGAVASGSIDVLKHCIIRGAVPTHRPGGGNNAFDKAASLGKVDILQELLTHPKGKDCINAQPEGGNTPLMLAAFARHADVITFLLNANAKVNVKGGPASAADGGNALHCALDWLGRFDGKATRFIVEPTRRAVAALLTSDALDVNLVAADGRSPWQLAQHHDSIRTLIENHPRFDVASLPANSKSPLHIAVQNEDRDKIETLLEQASFRALVNKTVDSVNPANDMIRMGMGRLVADLIAANELDPWPADGNSLFDEAWFAGDDDLVAAIRERMPDTLSAPSLIAVLKTAETGNPSGTTKPSRVPDMALIDACIARADGQATLNAALLFMGQRGAVALFRKLVAAGADPAATDEWGRTILERSADVVIVAEGGTKDAWPVKDDGPVTLPFMDEERATLARGDLEEITAMIIGWGADARRDTWGRTAVDLVPDALQAELAELEEAK
ncbi:ankyrin repeat domain-containing protein [Tateyamaria sp. SN6-1]|uniref:ankyrin repeat domain-containing protein n=1 Tax=Tateyamaria sp. SN6-1 TaxID=3092148 RepID=UPI0039F573F8